MFDKYPLLKRTSSFGAIVLLGALFLESANADNPEPVTAEVEFFDPITITEANALRFGLLDQNLGTAETVVTPPNRAVTNAGSNVRGGTINFLCFAQPKRSSFHSLRNGEASNLQSSYRERTCRRNQDPRHGCFQCILSTTSPVTVKTLNRIDLTGSLSTQDSSITER